MSQAKSAEGRQKRGAALKLTITKFLLLGTCLAGCDSLVEEQLLKVEMRGSMDAATGATGDDDPDFQTYVLSDLALVHEDGDTRTQLFDPAESGLQSSFRIIDRAQRIYSRNIESLTGRSFTAIEATFEALVTGGNADHPEMSFTLSTPTLTLSRAFEVETAKSLLFEIEVHWGKTIQGETMSEPSFELTLDGK